jgi:hypothetical protein
LSAKRGELYEGIETESFDGRRLGPAAETAGERGESVSAADIAAALGDARREGRAWRCQCPLRGGRSLVIRDGDGGSLLVTCWGGCDRLDLLAQLRQRGLLSGRSDYAPRIIAARRCDSDASFSALRKTFP